MFRRAVSRDKIILRSAGNQYQTAQPNRVTTPQPIKISNQPANGGARPAQNDSPANTVAKTVIRHRPTTQHRRRTGIGRKIRINADAAV